MNNGHKSSVAGERESIRARPIRWLCVGFAVCLLITLTSYGLVGAGRMVRVGVYQNQPKVFMDENGQATGFFIELLDEIAAQEGWNLVYVPCDWTKCLEALTAGDIDLLPDMAYSQERAEIYDFHSLPVVESWSRVYARAGASISRFPDLVGKRVALLEGSIQETVFAQMVAGFGYEITIVPVQSLDAAFALVGAGGADAAIANKFFGDYFYQEYGLEKTAIVLNAATLYYVTAQGQNHELLEAIDRHLGEWHEIPNSPYYTTLARWMEKPVMELPPRYWRETIAVGVGILLLLGGGTLLLRKQVADRTRWLAQANAQLQETEATLQLTLEAANEGRWDWYPQTGEVLWDARSYAMLGYEPNAFPMNMERWGELLHPDDRKGIWDLLQPQLGDDARFSIEFRSQHQDGHWVWINGRGKVIALDEKGEIQRVIGTYIDISPRKQAEEALARSENKYRRLHESMMDGFVYTDMTGHIQEHNRVFQEMLGYSDEELRQLTYMDLTPEKWGAFEQRIIEEQITVNGFSDIYEKEYRRQDGTILPVELRVFLIQDDAGANEGMWAIVRDITERKQVEKALRESENKYRTLFDQSIQGIYLHDLEGRMLDANQAACLQSGYSQDELLELNILDLLSTDETTVNLPRDEILRLWDQWQPYEKHQFEAEHRHKNGSCYSVEISTGIVQLGDGRYILATAQDVTARKEAEISLQRRYQELAAIYGVSRQLHNLMSPELLAQKVIATLEQALNYTFGAVLLVDEVSGMLEPFALSDQNRGVEFLDSDKEYVRAKGICLGMGIVGWVAEYGESLCIGDVREDSRYVALREDIRSELCVPLWLQNRVIGVVNVESTMPNAYSKDDQRLLENIAAQISVAIQNTNLYYRAQQEIASREQAETALHAALLEREALLREVHHRVKNNLQVVCALLDLQAFQADSPQLQKLLEESGQRIRSMAHIHEQLTQAENLAQVDMATYIHNLVTELGRSYSMEWVAVDYAIEAIVLPFDLISPCGLLINELVSNAFKYAFPLDWRGSQAKIQIALRVEPGPDAQARLTVADNGVGLPATLDVQASASLGLTLVKLLARQLRGVLKIGGEGESGAVFNVTFPLPQQGYHQISQVAIR